MVNLQLVTHTIALTILISLANVALFLALLLKPISEKLAWSLACSTAEWFWSYMQYHWEESLHAKDALSISGDEIPEGESAVVISNHLSYADYYLVQSLATRKKMLGSCRYFVKKEIVWQIPVFGWAFWAVGMILVSRNWTSDAGLIEEAFGRIKKNKHPVWVILYPEGTRRTPKKLLESQAFARRHGKAEYRRVLFPRTKGFISTVQGLRDSHVKYVYDLTFLYLSPSGKSGHASANGTNGTSRNGDARATASTGSAGLMNADPRERVPSLAEQLSCSDLKKAGYRYHIHVKRYAIADLPADEEGLKEWCEIRWSEKDLLLADWVKSATDTGDKKSS